MRLAGDLSFHLRDYEARPSQFVIAAVLQQLASCLEYSLTIIELHSELQLQAALSYYRNVPCPASCSLQDSALQRLQCTVKLEGFAFHCRANLRDALSHPVTLCRCARLCEVVSDFKQVGCASLPLLDISRQSRLATAKDRSWKHAAGAYEMLAPLCPSWRHRCEVPVRRGGVFVPTSPAAPEVPATQRQ